MKFIEIKELNDVEQGSIIEISLNNNGFVVDYRDESTARSMVGMLFEVPKMFARGEPPVSVHLGRRAVRTYVPISPKFEYCELKVRLLKSRKEILAEAGLDQDEI